MIRIALQMLTGETGRYPGIIAGVVFSAFLLTQQLATFAGFTAQTYSGISTVGAEIWVMDPGVRYIDDSKPMSEGQLARVRSVQGVSWAGPLYKGTVRSRLDDGKFEAVALYGIDDATLFGGPINMVEGSLADLRSGDAVVVDSLSAIEKLGHIDAEGKRISLRVGDTLELNDRRAVVVGLCKADRGFQGLPVVCTTYHRALEFAPFERKMLSFILVRVQKGSSTEQVAQRMLAVTGTAVIFMCLIASLISIRKVMRLEPAVVFKG